MRRLVEGLGRDKSQRTQTYTAYGATRTGANLIAYRCGAAYWSCPTLTLANPDLTLTPSATNPVDRVETHAASLSSISRPGGRARALDSKFYDSADRLHEITMAGDIVYYCARCLHGRMHAASTGEYYINTFSHFSGPC
jgi:hypothetical protein